MEIKSILLIASLVALAACASQPVVIKTPMIVTGLVSHAESTEWYRNYCSSGELINSSPDCMQLGGEIFKVKLLKPRDIHGKSLGKALVIAYPAHALRQDYVWPRRSLFLVSAPAEFQEKTGITLYAPAYGIYDNIKNCVDNDGYAHSDFRLCPDKSFHEKFKDQCIPVETFLLHYGNSP